MDKPGNPLGRDSKRVSLNEDHEVRTWTKHFHCSEAELRAAVAAKGPMVEDLEAYFRAHPPKR